MRECLDGRGRHSPQTTIAGAEYRNRREGGRPPIGVEWTDFLWGGLTRFSCEHPSAGNRTTKRTMRSLLGTFCVVMLICGAIESRAAAGDNTLLASVASAVVSAKRIEAWRLSCLDTLSSGVRFKSAKRVVGQAADLDSFSRGQLVAILLGASRDTAECFDYKCSYCPGYRLIINDGEPPVEVIVTEGCTVWQFTRAGKSMAGGAYCGNLPAGFLAPFRALLKRIYGPQFEN